MEENVPVSDLLNDIEAIVFKNAESLSACMSAPDIVLLPEPQQLREMAGLEVDEFARAMGVSVTAVKRWEAKRTKPSATVQKLMQLLHENPYLGKQLLQ